MLKGSRDPSPSTSTTALDSTQGQSTNNFFIGSDSITLESSEKCANPHVSGATFANADRSQELEMEVLTKSPKPVLPPSVVYPEAPAQSVSPEMLLEIRPATESIDSSPRYMTLYEIPRYYLVGREEVPSVTVDMSPDENYRWLVVFGSFLCLFVIEGLCFSYGLYMFGIISEMRFSVASPNSTSPSLTALTLPGALLTGLRALMGPLAGALVDSLTFRSVASCGALIAFIGVLLSAFSSDLTWFTLLYGATGGIGIGLIYLPSITVVGHWFEHRRGFAVGLALCGGGFGVGIFCSTIVPTLFGYGWHGCILLTSAIIVQTLTGIFLFRPLYTHELIRMLHKRRYPRRIRTIYKATYRVYDRLGHLVQRSRPTGEKERHPNIKRGSIMSRIIEEKCRQRTTSTGSLDGMVITRENELVALPNPEAYETVKAAAAAFVAQQQQQPPNSSESVEPIGAQPSTSNVEPRPFCGVVDDPPILQTVQEDIPLTDTRQSQAELTACVAVLPPPVQFSRAGIRRIALAIIRKLQAAQLIPLASVHSALALNADQPSSSEERRIPTESAIRCLSESGAPNLELVRKVTTEPSQPPPRRTSLISLDSRVTDFIATELSSLPLEETTTMAIVAALRDELGRPKYRVDFFYDGVGKRQSHAEASEQREEQGTVQEHLRAPASIGDGIQNDDTILPARVQPTQPSSTPPLDTQNNQTGNLLNQPVESESKLEEILVYLGSMLHPDPLKSATFLLFLTASTIFMFVLLVPYHYLPLLLKFGGIECAHNRLWCPNGLPHQAALKPRSLDRLIKWSSGDPELSTFFASPGAVLATIGFSHIAGRLFASIYVERQVHGNSKLFCCVRRIRNPLVVNVVSLLVCALSVSCYPLAIHGVTGSMGPNTPDLDRIASGHTSLMQKWSMSFRIVLLYMAAVAYGTASATVFSVRSVTLVDLFGLNRLTNVFGYVLLFEGLAMCIGPPILGYFCNSDCSPVLGFTHVRIDTVPSFPTRSRLSSCSRQLNMLFYLCAGLLAISSFLFIPLRRLSSRDITCQCACRHPEPDLRQTTSVMASNLTHVNYNPQDTQTTQIITPS